MLSMSNLPLDLLEDILSRLPVKSLLRFRCVSKEWQSLICDSEFTLLHLNRSKEKKPSYVLITSGVSSISYTVVENNHPSSCSYDFKSLWNCEFQAKVRVKSLSSCNGLICFLLSGDNYVRYEEPMYLLNPATQELKKLPSPHHREVVSYSGDDRVAIGFDPTNRDYKVVKLCTRVKGNSCRIAMKVYSLNSNKWRKVEDAPFQVEEIKLGMPIINFALHWMTDSGNIYSFDLVHEVLRELPSLLEPEFKDKKCYLDLFDMEGTLSLVRRNLQVQELELWRMKEYGIGESWTKLGSFNWGLWRFTPVGLWNDDDILLQLKGNNDELVLHNTRNNTERKFVIRGHPAPMFKAITLNESLVKLNNRFESWKWFNMMNCWWPN